MLQKCRKSCSSRNSLIGRLLLPSFRRTLLSSVVLDGGAEFYDTNSASRFLCPGLTRCVEPRGLQRSIATILKLQGSNLLGITELKLPNQKLAGEIVQNTTAARVLLGFALRPQPIFRPVHYELVSSAKGGRKQQNQNLRR